MGLAQPEAMALAVEAATMFDTDRGLCDARLLWAWFLALRPGFVGARVLASAGFWRKRKCLSCGGGALCGDREGDVCLGMPSCGRRDDEGGVRPW